MAQARLAVATWEYRGTDGQFRRAFFGDLVDLADEDHADALELGFVKPAGEPSASENAPAPTPDSDDPESDDAQEVTPPPLHVATKATWVAYAVSKGFSKAEAEDMTKEQLIAALR